MTRKMVIVILCFIAVFSLSKQSFAEWKGCGCKGPSEVDCWTGKVDLQCFDRCFYGDIRRPPGFRENANQRCKKQCQSWVDKNACCNGRTVNGQFKEGCCDQMIDLCAAACPYKDKSATTEAQAPGTPSKCEVVEVEQSIVDRLANAADINAELDAVLSEYLGSGSTTTNGTPANY